jgi:hypothetical protein
MSNLALTEGLNPDHAPAKLSDVAQSAMQLMLSLEEAGLITPRSLTLPEGIEYGTAEALGVFIAEIKTRGNFYIGDWMIECEEKLPTEFSQLAEATGLSEPTRLFIMSVCRAVPPNRRRDTLTWSHHVAVYKLPAKEQRSWLAAAEKNGWSYTELRTQMKADRQDARPQLPGTEDHSRDPDMALLLEASRSMIHNAEIAGENVICRIEDYTRVKAALGEEE